MLIAKLEIIDTDTNKVTTHTGEVIKTNSGFLVYNKQSKTEPIVKKICRDVGNYFGVDTAKILAGKRSKMHCKPRFIAMFILKNHFHMSYKEIGEQFSGRHHTTICNSISRAEEFIAKEPYISDLIRDIVETNKYQ